LSDERMHVEILDFPIFSIIMYAATSAYLYNPFNSDMQNLIWGIMYFYIVVVIIWNNRRNRESFPVDVILPISMGLIYILFLWFFYNNKYLFSFLHLVYVILAIIVEEKFTRNIIKNYRIEAKREKIKEYYIVINAGISLITLFLVFAIASSYSPPLEKSLFTLSFVEFLATPQILVWIITYICVVLYNYLVFRRLLSHVEYVEGSDDRI